MGKRVGTAKWMEKQNRWQIKVQKDGERKTFTSSKPGRTGQREANAKADAWLDDGIENLNKRVSPLLDEFIADLKARTSKSHWRNEEYRCRIYLEPGIGKKKINKITDQDLQNIINSAYQKGLSKKSLMNLRATMTAFFKFCRKNRVSSFYPEDIVIPSSAVKKEKRILQPEHLTTLFTIDTTLYRGNRIFDPFIYAYRLQVLTGIRPGELLGIRKNDIFQDFIKIRGSINIYGEHTSGKNKNAIRIVPLSAFAADIVQKQLELSQTDFLFEIKSEPYYRKRWQIYCEANHIPRISPYELRHTFVSIAKNLPEGQLKRIVGHSMNMDTYGVYSHMISGEIDHTVTNLDNIFTQFLDIKK